MYKGVTTAYNHFNNLGLTDMPVEGIRRVLAANLNGTRSIANTDDSSGCGLAATTIQPVNMRNDG